jgi:glycosyltransferase involved in cell wall biosynthesis
LRLVALVHLPLAADPGLEPLDRPALAASEARAFRSATRIVITGPATQNLLETYDVPSERLALVEPGTDRPSPASLAAAQTERQRVGGVTRLLSVATVNPGKGHIALLGALAATGLTKWHLTCAGSLTRNPETATAVRRSIVGLGLSKHVSLLGDINEAGLETAHCAADVFVLATRRETYGMAVADALAWGLPVVSTHTGAIPDLVGDGAGIVVPVDSQDALTHALYRVLSDAPLRVRLATGALAAAERLPSWHDQVVAFERVLDAVP